MGEEKEEQYELLIARIENLALTGSAYAADCLAYAYREGILVEKDVEREAYFNKMKAFWLDEPWPEDDENEPKQTIVQKG